MKAFENVPTIINVKGELRKLSITRYENKWGVTYLLNDTDIDYKAKAWTADGVFTNTVPIVFGKTLPEALEKLKKLSITNK